jgi:hypothetical protein
MPRDFAARPARLRPPAAASARELLLRRGLYYYSRVKTDDENPAVTEPGPGPSAPLMAHLADTFLSALGAEQRDKAIIAFDDEERMNWHYVPKPRLGVPLKELDQAQRQLASALMSAGLSREGFAKASVIMSLESVLFELEGGSPRRDAELYYFTVFGRPGAQTPWGWRVEGHHVSLNYTLAARGRVSSTPSFFGANPAEVRHGPRKGLRALKGEEDLGRALLASLNDGQRAEAVISASAPLDILSGNSRKAAPVEAAGIAASRLHPKQADLLMKLVGHYAASMASDIAAARMQKVLSAGFGEVTFAWAGAGEPGKPHYYRVQGPTFLLEYDNVQNDPNHIHTVWRDFDGDFGADLLAMHYRDDHR